VRFSSIVSLVSRKDHHGQQRRNFRGLFIATVVADYLLNTKRVLKAIALFKECLILPNDKALGDEKELSRSAYFAISSAVMHGFYLVNDLTSVLECGSTLSPFYEHGATKREKRHCLQG